MEIWRHIVSTSPTKLELAGASLCRLDNPIALVDFSDLRIAETSQSQSLAELTV